MFTAKLFHHNNRVLGLIHTGRATRRARKSEYFFLWCCLRAVWTLPLTTTGPICLHCIARRVARPVWIRPYVYRCSKTHSKFRKYTHINLISKRRRLFHVLHCVTCWNKTLSRVYSTSILRQFEFPCTGCIVRKCSHNSKIYMTDTFFAVIPGKRKTFEMCGICRPSWIRCRTKIFWSKFGTKFSIAYKNWHPIHGETLSLWRTNSWTAVGTHPRTHCCGTQHHVPHPSYCTALCYFPERRDVLKLGYMHTDIRRSFKRLVTQKASESFLFFMKSVASIQVNSAAVSLFKRSVMIGRFWGRKNQKGRDLETALNCLSPWIKAACLYCLKLRRMWIFFRKVRKNEKSCFVFEKLCRDQEHGILTWKEFSNFVQNQRRKARVEDTVNTCGVGTCFHAGLGLLTRSPKDALSKWLMPLPSHSVATADGACHYFSFACLSRATCHCETQELPTNWSFVFCLCSVVGFSSTKSIHPEHSLPDFSETPNDPFAKPLFLARFVLYSWVLFFWDNCGKTESLQIPLSGLLCDSYQCVLSS